MSTFVPAFWSTFRAVFDIFLVILLGGILVRRGLVSQAQVTGLVAATVNVFLPALIFSNIVTTFNPSALSYWWTLPLAAVAMTAAGLALAWVAYGRGWPQTKPLFSLISLQNAGYLVLPVGSRLYADQFDLFALYTFLFILGVNPLLWSLGPWLTTQRGSRLGVKGLLTPPLVAAFAGVALALAHGQKWVPGVILNVSTLLGQAAVPVAIFSLGAILGDLPCCLRTYLREALVVSGLKLLVLPAAVIAVLAAASVHRVDPLLAEFMVIQSASAPATNLILQVRNYGGDEARVGSNMLVAYALCALTLPLCLVVWRMLAP